MKASCSSCKLFFFLFFLHPALPPSMHSARFRYRRQDPGGGADEEESVWLEQEVPCFLDIHVHHARNICVSAHQDVYAQFALTCAPDHAPALCTPAGRGASPTFDERLAPLRVRRGRLLVDVLKCEVWTRSRTCVETTSTALRREVEDQLLGFALVPLSDVAATDGARLSQVDLELSSTDLLRSPAGTIRLSLGLRSGLPRDDACPPPPERNEEPSITSEVVIFEPERSRIESPGPGLINVVKGNHDDVAVHKYLLPFLQLGEARPTGATEDDDFEMSTRPRGDGENPASSDGSKNASTTTTASDDRATTSCSSAMAAMEKPPLLAEEAHESTREPGSRGSPETPTSSNGKKAGKDRKGDVFTSPLEGIDMDAEQSEMQRQVVDMYVRSMQQFSESLAGVKMTIEHVAGGDGIVVQKEQRQPGDDVKKPLPRMKNDGARVFYGSRAFF